MEIGEVKSALPTAGRIAGRRFTVPEAHYHRTGRKIDEQEGR
jgi:hypothetical protein